MTTYDIGDAPQAVCEFRNVSGALANPTAVLVKMVAPDGAISTLDGVANTDVGIFKVTLPRFTRAGGYTVKFFGTGALTAAEETRFSVRASRA